MVSTSDFWIYRPDAIFRLIQPIIRIPNNKKPSRFNRDGFLILIRGAGGIRTLVRTKRLRAFYMFSF